MSRRGSEDRIPTSVLRALEALAQSPINTSALAMAEAQGCNHDTLYRALDYPLPYFFSLCLPLCRTLGGPKGGYLLISSSTMSLSPATAQASSASNA
ncbi:hypothetical protein Mtai_v1c29800 (plasmid) [Meiothermus taiwanensis WR-220]|nr:hypothetical protein Mtai_v1c29800 [Meiothermus taiwanensis WR-220]RIH74226.1 hypothetical protein Mhypo_03459 [Meiothermus hypogaeus]GIW29803.1 MAG: hypothetical protein KatS3mg070_3166 [Meiothermus sp.]